MSLYNQDQFIKDLDFITEGLTVQDPKSLYSYANAYLEDLVVHFGVLDHKIVPYKVWWKSERVDLDNIDINSDLAKFMVNKLQEKNDINR